jgi:hypothetical protein
MVICNPLIISFPRSLDAVTPGRHAVDDAASVRAFLPQRNRSSDDDGIVVASESTGKICDPEHLV